MKRTCLVIGLLLSLAAAGCGAFSPRRAVRDGEAALKDHNYEAAVRHFNRAARRLPNDATLHYNLATAHFLLGSFVPAEAALKQVLAIEPGNLNARELQGQIALYRGEWAKARAIFNELLAATPQARARFLTALSNVERGATRYDLARVRLLQAVKADWKYAPAHYNLALLYRDHFSLTDEAIDELELFRRMALSSDPRHAEVAKTLEALRRAQKNNSRIPPPAEHRDVDTAAARVKEGDRAGAIRSWSRAEKAYRDALAADPQCAAAASGLGQALLGQGEYRQALEAFRQATVLNPGYADAFYQGALAALELKDLPEAGRLLNQAAAKWPDRYGFFALLATLRSTEENPNGARAYGEYYLQTAPAGEQRKRYEVWLATLPADRGT
jgi:tetratricopeptide (TPR) repeat protein